MESLAKHLTDELFWTQPMAMHRAYELQSSGLVVATLEFETAFGSLATARADGDAWSFKRMGFFRPHVTVRIAGTEDDLAVYRPKWTGTEGELAFRDGTIFTWTITNFWATRYEVKDSAGQTLVEYKSGGRDSGLRDFFRSQATVTVTDAGRRYRQTGLLVLVGWYLILLQQSDAAAAAVAASSAD